MQDVNDNAPTFDAQHLRTGSISEAAPVGTSVLTVVATDNDDTNNAVLHYTIGSADSNSASRDHEYFDIEPDTGVIRSKQSLDHETQRVMTFTVIATDGGVPPLNGSMQVRVDVTDINDNPPRFDRPEYDVFVTDLASRGQLVTRVSASDADSGDGDAGMRYSIVDGNTRQSFEIDALSGVISLSSLRTPDLLASNYVLNVSVTDGVFTNFARVKITVRHANSHVPRFERGVYSGEVFENLPRHTTVTTVRATDDDRGIYGEVTYYIDSDDVKDVFEIDSESGEANMIVFDFFRCFAIVRTCTQMSFLANCMCT